MLFPGLKRNMIARRECWLPSDGLAASVLGDEGAAHIVLSLVTEAP